MKIKTLLAALAALIFVQFPGDAFALGCPGAMAEAQAAIDKVKADMKGMKGQMSKSDAALVHALLDDAKMLLAGAKHNHTKPQGAYDHARSLAKAGSALNYAKAADALHFKYMKK